MLNREQIMDKLKELNFPKEQFCVMTGAALVLHGVRQETADIDIGCTKELFAKLLQSGFELAAGKVYRGIVIEGFIEIFEDWMPEKSILIDGIPVADIHDIRRYKEQKGRDKDLRDIELIDRFINQGNSC
ncbi:MAG: hypothetical protein K0R84_2375 [Clostridia bacterium]|nr:hypothetical protein [Clostridia bacterium]